MCGAERVDGHCPETPTSRRENLAAARGFTTAIYVSCPSFIGWVRPRPKALHRLLRDRRVLPGAPHSLNCNGTQKKEKKLVEFEPPLTTHHSPDQ